MAETPPPIPSRPAGFWWRSLAFLADAIPLGALAQVIAERTAGADAQAGRVALDGWVRQVADAYARVAQGGPSSALADLLGALPAPVADWFAHAGIVAVVTFTLVLGLQEALLGGRTLGKMMVNLRVLDTRTGESPSAAGCLLRAACKAMFLWLPNPLVGLLALVNFHLPLFRRDHRAIHDLATHTQVVDGRASR